VLRWICLLLALLCLPTGAQELSLRTVRQAGSLVKYAPDGDPRQPGLCMEILLAVERIDPGLRFDGTDQQVPLKRVERLLAERQIDAFFCLLKSPDREAQWRYLPVPLYTIRHVLVQRAADARPFGTLAELALASRYKPVAITRGTVLRQPLEAAGVRYVEVSSEREALQMLALGRADAVYGQDINLLRYIADERLGEQLSVSRNAFHEESQFLTTRADLPAAQVERLTQALRRLERDGTLRELSGKYR